MEHVDTGTMEDWYANRALPFPVKLERLAVVAPDDAPGLRALRQRLAQRVNQSLCCDHYTAGFNGPASAALGAVFDQIRRRHATEPYDVVLLLDGSPDALGIAESNGLVPAQVCRMPAPVWTAIGEDDANTELGDVANRVFANPAALIDALPLLAAPPKTAAALSQAPMTEAAQDGAFSLVLEPAEVRMTRLSALAVAPAPASAPVRARTHPLVLCAAGAVIVASLTAVATMLGWLPNQRVAAAPPAPVESMAVKAPAAAPATIAAPKEEPPAAVPVVNKPASEPAPQPVPVTTPQPVPVTAPAPQTGDTDGGAGEVAAAAAGGAGVAGAAGLIAAAAAPPRRAASVSPKPKKQAARHKPRSGAPIYAEAPRQVGSNEVPVVEFVGTKTREQVIAEMIAARRLADRQAAAGSFSPDISRRTSRR